VRYRHHYGIRAREVLPRQQANPVLAHRLIGIGPGIMDKDFDVVALQFPDDVGHL
jgi:hypothetical protein